MLSFRRSALLLTIAVGIGAGTAAAQPALTTIQDILYVANGSRYTGTLFINWSSFQSGDSSNIATASLTVPIVNGVLSVKLVPTTTASAGAQYNVTYSNAGINQFTQVWAVPPSSVPLRVRDVLVSQGTVVGPLPVTSPIQISDVTGLQNALALLPMEGVGFAIGRTAVINTSGQIDGAAGNLSDCVRVDGSSGPCGSGGGGVLPSFSDSEVPSGSINGSNTTFTLANSPSPAASLDLSLNGLLMKSGTDFTLSGNTISFLIASTPQTGDILVASYRYGNPSNPLGSLTAAQVVCSSVGATTNLTTLTSLGTCTLPAGLIEAGDRIQIQFQYAHSGSSTGFTGEIHWGGTTIVSRAASSSETAYVGKIEIGVYSGAQAWDVQSWGSALSLAAGVGSATENTSQNLTISFYGSMAGATSDTAILRNFTVIRYPAQTNP
jgi:hypothetical protein